MAELPHKLKLELAMQIHHKMYASVKFFDLKEKSFIVWMDTVMRPLNIQEEEYVYKEGEIIVEMYFMVNGSCGNVLPRYENQMYH